MLIQENWKKSVLEKHKQLVKENSCSIILIKNQFSLIQKIKEIRERKLITHSLTIWNHNLKLILFLLFYWFHRICDLK